MAKSQCFRARLLSAMYVRFAVPDLETVPFRVLKREADYEIREVEVNLVISFTFLFEADQFSLHA